MDFDFKWWILGFCGLMVIGGVLDLFKEHNKTQIELAKIQNNKCECK